MYQLNPNDNQYLHQSKLPLIIELDGTLIKSDLLFESFYSMIKHNLFLVFLLPLWFLHGKVYLKKQIAKHSYIDVESLPYQQMFIEFLRIEFNNGRKLILVTASFKTLAIKVANYLGIFSEVLSTDENINISGKQRLEVLLKKYGKQGFDYAGNGNPDHRIFPYARYAILVNPRKNILKTVKEHPHVRQVFDERNHGILPYFKVLRIHQWLKNLLLFIPLLTSHQWLNISIIIKSIVGFIAFNICASGGYLFNDLLDLPSDRNHPIKKHRPFTSGELSIISGSILMILLVIIGLIIAAVINWRFFGILLLYSLLTFAYTIHLKMYVLLDVLVLAILYTVRVIAGAELIQVPLSFWLLAFSLFLFFSLALIKRCSELYELIKIGSEQTRGRDYHITDINYLREMGIVSGYLSIIVVALYINSTNVVILYSHPKVLWLICLVLFYWISRLWLKTGRGEMTEDPIIFSLKDRGSQYIMLAVVVIILFAI